MTEPLHISRGITDLPTPTLDPDAATKQYVDDNAGGSIDVTDGSTTVSPATSIDFTSGATVTDGGSGIAQVAVSGGGSTVQIETPSGTIDGSNDTFTLSAAPDPPEDLMVWKSGLYQTQDVDYTLTTDTIVFTVPPATGSVLTAGLPATGGGGGGITPSASRIVILNIASSYTVTAGTGSTLISWSNFAGSLTVDLTDPTHPQLDPGVYSMVAYVVVGSPGSPPLASDQAAFQVGYDDSEVGGSGIAAFLSQSAAQVISAADAGLSGGGPFVLVGAGTVEAWIDATASSVDFDVNGAQLTIVKFS